MYNPQPERMKAFWTAVQDVWLKLYGSSFPTAAAINVSIMIRHRNVEFVIPFQLVNLPSPSSFELLVNLNRFKMTVFLVGSLTSWRMFVVNLLRVSSYGKQLHDRSE